MNASIRRTTSLAILAAALVAGAPAIAADSEWAVELAVGAQAKDVSGEYDGKFEQYRDVPEGIVFPSLRLRFQDVESPWDFSLTGDDLGEKDFDARLDFGRAGRVRGSVLFDRLPHTSATGATSLFGHENGRLVVDPAARAALEANPRDTPAVVDQYGRPIDLAIQRDTLALDVDFRLARGLWLGLFAATVEREGDQRIGTGTYIRRQQVGTGTPTGPGYFDRERVEPRGAELPAPIDTKTQDFGFNLDFGRGRVYAMVDWQESSFDNDAGTLSWDNPFEFPPGASSSASGVNPGADQEPASPVGNTSLRGRFTTASLDLAPDNDYERFNLAGGVDLPGRTRFHVAYAEAEITQNDRFLPYTENEAIIFFNGPDGLAGTADDVKGPDGPLPAASLDGKTETTRLDLRLTSRPIDQLSLRASYRDYEYEDGRPSLQFPGYAAAGDSYIRRSAGQKDAAGNRILFNPIGGYDRSTWSAGGAWRFGKTATLDLDYRNTEWSYEERQVESTSEDTFQAKLDLRLGDRVGARLTWLDASRDFDGNYAVGLETSRLRAFDVWTRDRSRYGIELDFEASESWVFGVEWSQWEDDYPGVVPGVSSSNPFPSQPYGLNEATSDTLAASASYSAERVRATFAVGSDSSEWRSLGVPKTSLPSDSIQFDPVNAWVRSQEDDILWATVGIEADLVPEKLTLSADLGWYDSDFETVTSSVGTPNINSGVAYDFGSDSSDLFSGKLRLDWTVRDNFGVYFGYLYEPYRLDDFAWDSLQPWMQGVIKETGSSPTDIRDGVVERYLFLDSRYSDYTANVLTAGVTFKY